MLRSIAIRATLLWLGVGCGPPPPEAEDAILNGCAPDDFVAAPLEDGLVTIRFGHEAGHNYRPRCLRVSLATRIRFEGPFDAHPLAPGRIEAGLPIDGDGAPGPVAEVSGGQSAEFVADTPGRFGYYCDSHVVEGMLGAIEVVDSASRRSRSGG